MRLRIESTSNHTRLSHSYEGSCVLPVYVKPQQAENWCWSAIGSALLGYFHGQVTSQQAFAKQLLLSVAENTTERKHTGHYDRCALLSDVLGLVNCYSHWSPGRPTYKRIYSEIHKGHPVCLRVQWVTGDSHYVMITGVHPATGEICIEDSIYGASTQIFHSFPACYKGIGGVWRETYWTCFPARTGESINSYE